MGGDWGGRDMSVAFAGGSGTGFWISIHDEAMGVWVGRLGAYQEFYIAFKIQRTYLGYFGFKFGELQHSSSPSTSSVVPEGRLHEDGPNIRIVTKYLQLRGLYLGMCLYRPSLSFWSANQKLKKRDRAQMSDQMSF